MKNWFRDYWPIVFVLFLFVTVLGFGLTMAARQQTARTEAIKNLGIVSELTKHRQPFRIYKIQTEDGYVVCTMKWACYVPAAAPVAERVDRGN